VFKYDVTLEDGKSWLLYALPTTGADPALKLVSNTLLQGPTGWSGTIQVAKNPAGAAGEAVFDASSGVYATGATVSGSATGSTGTYSISWTKAGLSNGQPLVMFALPHLVSSFDSTTAAAQTNITLQTTTKGVAVAVVADQITMVESALPVSMSFAPWTPATGSKVALSSTALTAIIGAASDEVTQDMGAQSNLDSMYYSGKALSKFASIVYTLHDIANQTTLAAQGLAQLKVAYARFSTNQQIYPLVYDTAWKGVVSSATYTTGNTGEDFGNTLYNGTCPRELAHPAANKADRPPFPLRLLHPCSCRYCLPRPYLAGGKPRLGAGAGTRRVEPQHRRHVLSRLPIVRLVPRTLVCQRPL
jgi:endo-1,3(4)-beta-glucanase